MCYCFRKLLPFKHPMKYYYVQFVKHYEKWKLLETRRLLWYKTYFPFFFFLYIYWVSFSHKCLINTLEHQFTNYIFFKIKLINYQRIKCADRIHLKIYTKSIKFEKNKNKTNQDFAFSTKFFTSTKVFVRANEYLISIYFKCNRRTTKNIDINI